jgi:hypothetical protein
MDISKVHQLGRALVDADLLCLVDKFLNKLKDVNRLIIDYVVDLCLHVQFGVKSFGAEGFAESACLQYSSESHLNSKWSELVCHFLAELRRLV